MGGEEMIEFAWPYLFLLLPLPFLLALLWPKKKVSETAALKVPELEDFTPFQHAKALQRGGYFPLLLSTLAWIALVTAAARPQWIGEPIDIPQTGRDLMLAVDLSGSMMINDFEVKGQAVDRLSALKMILGDFIDRRKGDRLGLILFGSQAYLQTPLTFDATTVKQLLMEAVVGLAGKETALGDAIGLAVKQLRDSPQESRVLILFTDGNNNTGELVPEKAAELAANAQLKVHTVAIGSNEAMVQTLFGARRVHPSADIDETALKMIAEKTGGQYFRAYDTKDLVKIYQKLDQIERIEHESKTFRPTDEIYFYPLMAALFLLGSLIVLRIVR
jgi:Ca-activated chloride channel homolog